VVAACLETTGIGHQDFVDIALRLLAHRAMAEVLATGARDGWDAAAQRLLGPDHRLLERPLLLGALRQGLNVLVPFERLFTAVRRRLLLVPPAHDAALEFVEALAEQCFLNEYLFHVTAQEAAALDSAISRLGDALAGGGTLDDAIVRDALRVATYRLPADLPFADRLLEAAAGRAPLDRLVALTIVEPRADRAAVADVPVLAAPSDATSQRVQAQYEANPYPRWRSLTVPVPGAALAGLARYVDAATIARLGHQPRVLVAGCGTGAHAIPCAVKYGPRAKVTAIDLSRPSLAYAMRRARSLGVGGITFAQADILALDDRVGPFDVIECGGVLHHMADPVAGWRALAGRLVPGGVMKLGLYSERARRFVKAAIADAQASGAAPTPEGIRAYRHHLIATVPGPWAVPLARYRDFFSISQCRDLLFNVVEHRFTPRQLGEAIAAVGLSFRGFQLPSAVHAAYRNRFPEDPRGLDLAKWDAFEEDHPDTFEAMFQFWCVKTP
jgi:SAM-dependent methyltransferase